MSEITGLDENGNKNRRKRRNLKAAGGGALNGEGKDIINVLYVISKARQ